MAKGVSYFGFTLFAVLPILFTLLPERLWSRRTAKIPHGEERVIILGASSGVGREMALVYARRGARLCVVGRRQEQLNEVVSECEELVGGVGGKNKVLRVSGDFSNVEDMLRLRTLLGMEWGGLDTVIVTAGVSTLRPLMDVAGVEGDNTISTQTGIQNVVEVAAAATRGNYIGPLVAAVTFIPLLSSSSRCPAILLVSSLAALIPPPTRSLYASTKAASLVLYQALSIEHPSIAFTNIIPATIDGNFRASAVDAGTVRRESNEKGRVLNRTQVAKRCVLAVDRHEKTVFLPGGMRFAHILYWVWPALVEWRARVKYNFQI